MYMLVQTAWLGTGKCRQSARLFLQSSELRLPHPLNRRRVCSPLLWFRGGYTLTAGEGVGGGLNSDEGTDTMVLYTIHRQYERSS
jgi:hypothetical protein